MVIKVKQIYLVGTCAEFDGGAFLYALLTSRRYAATASRLTLEVRRLIGCLDGPPRSLMSVNKLIKQQYCLQICTVSRVKQGGSLHRW